MCKISIITPLLHPKERNQLFNEIKKCFGSGKNSIALYETKDDCDSLIARLTTPPLAAEIIIIRKTSQGMTGTYAQKITMRWRSAPPIYGLHTGFANNAPLHEGLGLVTILNSIEQIAQDFYNKKKKAEKAA